ncbi:UDP-N-acetylglucosamine 1-carboxyvinyltransferase [Mobilitalea sibirica]|uniref:UDP-N-acetylglucosamine 1-carboxyvinyltransferase n=1 Tax=Mobilitalea sibirica TaxID=1462919 RepID=A0A8J7KX57_9FIRM|nr:UDP-N-acetylglucosamine 1-carboxyvinyltransferase [Mobilitalea sibirica]MBH1941367.1 UDP-N-acetylglucosamine 1-carboxyvinyltransferase [Mobilitalea sibirica]
MSSIKVIGGEQLKGELRIQGSKNAALPVIAATILNKGITKLNHCPKILDVFHMIKILEELGCKAAWEGNTLYVDSTTILNTSVSEMSVSKMRSSILFLGALLGRCHEVTIAYPGGCSIGKRPIDYHLSAIKKMNVCQEFMGEEDNIIHCYTNEIIGNDIFLEFPSVGATQNVVLSAVLSEGVTRIFNAAREPEVTELCNYLVEAGARICGKGTAFLEVEGVKKLHDVEFTLSPDRIVAGTYMTAVAAICGDAYLLNTPTRQLDTVIRMLRKVGCNLECMDDQVHVFCRQRPLPIDTLITKPYPGFPTDMQSQMLTVLSMANGKSTIIEEIFESRFQNVKELKKMGAIIHLEDKGKKAVISGVEKLHGAVVDAHDLRGGAALVLAGLAAEGTTIVREATSIERGYEDICRDLSILGANIKFCSENAS